MASNEFELVLQGQDAGLRAALQANIQTANQFDAAIQQMTRGAFEFSEAAGFVRMATQGQANALDVLNSLGIQSTGQIKQQIAALQELGEAYRNDAAITSQVAQRTQRLQQQLGDTTQTSLATGRAIFGMARILDGSTTSTQAATQHLLPLLRNLGQMQREAAASGTSVKSLLVGSLIGGGGLVLAIAAAETAIQLWTKRAEEARKKSEELKKEIEGVASAFLSIDSAIPEFAKVRLEQARQIKTEIEAQRDALTESVTELERFAAKQAKPIAFAQVQVTLNEQAQAILRETNDDASKALELGRERQLDAQVLAERLRSIVQEEEVRVRIAQKLAELGVQEEEDKKKKLTLLQEEIKNTAELRKTMATLAGQGAVRLAQQEALNRALQEELRLRRSRGQAEAGFLPFGGEIRPQTLTVGEVARQNIIGAAQGRLATQSLRGLDPAIWQKVALEARRISQEMEKVDVTAIAINVTLGIMKQRAFAAADALADRVTNIAFSLFSTESKFLSAQLELDRVLLQQSIGDLRESLREKEISQAEYAARVNLLNLEIAENQRALARETGDIITRTYLALADTIRETMSQLARDIVKSFIRAGIVKLLGTILGVQTAGFGSIFVGGLLGSGAAPGRFAPSTGAASALPVAATQTVHLNITGQFVQRGTDLVAVVTETTALGGA